MWTQYLIIGVIIAAAVAFFARRLWRKVRRTAGGDSGCGCGCGSEKKPKSTRATLTIAGRQVADRK
ncbi:MAG: FeoB-associated Cys-rich membrane protein [Phycisphaerales bacterium]